MVGSVHVLFNLCLSSELSRGGLVLLGLGLVVVLFFGVVVIFLNCGFFALSIVPSQLCGWSALRVFPGGHQVDGLPPAPSNS